MRCITIDIYMTAHLTKNDRAIFWHILIPNTHAGILARLVLEFTCARRIQRHDHARRQHPQRHADEEHSHLRCHAGERL